MRQRKLPKREAPEYIAEVNGVPFEEYLRQIPKERWDRFLEFIADLVFRDLQKELEEQTEGKPEQLELSL